MRNQDNYNLTLSIPHESLLYKALMEDAKRTGTKQYGVLAATRLDEYYRWQEQGLVALLTKLSSGGRIEVREIATTTTTTTVTEPSAETTRTRTLSLDEIVADCAGFDDAFPD